MAHESAGDSEELDFLELQRQHIIESIPEFSAFENHKENVLPRRKGRSAAELVSFAVDNEKRQEELQQGHEKFENELQQLDELDDPLEVYVRYIDWTEEMYPQGHNQESDLFELVREATTRFQNSEQYKNDVRYLRCWMKYADMLKEPGEVFQLVSKYKIGQMLAMYYEKYAAYLERNGRSVHPREKYQLEFVTDELTETMKQAQRRSKSAFGRYQPESPAFGTSGTVISPFSITFGK